MADSENTNVEDGSIDLSLRERLVLPIALPVIATVATIILIIIVGEILLLTVGSGEMTLAGERVVLATWVALIFTIIIMAIAALASRVVTNRRLFNSSRKGET
ncbi:MAG: hypothetical protein VYD72_05920 [Chloroflexota bacterium]|nr:hypothetical protein [Chloroflexota bacterium]